MQWVNNPPDIVYVKDKEDKHSLEYKIGFKTSNREEPLNKKLRKLRTEVKQRKGC